MGYVVASRNGAREANASPGIRKPQAGTAPQPVDELADSRLQTPGFRLQPGTCLGPLRGTGQASCARSRIVHDVRVGAGRATGHLQGQTSSRMKQVCPPFHPSAHTPRAGDPALEMSAERPGSPTCGLVHVGVGSEAKQTARSSEAEPRTLMHLGGLRRSFARQTLERERRWGRIWDEPLEVTDPPAHRVHIIDRFDFPRRRR
jgi:hypothetical protein